MNTSFNQKLSFFLFCLFLSSGLFAQQPSSIYKDSKVVADYLKKYRLPSINFSSLPDSTRNKLTIWDSDNKKLEIPKKGKFDIAKEDEYRLYLELESQDSIY